MTPGEAEQARHEIRRAEEALREARVLLDAAAREGVANRVYYAAFHAARAALTVRGLHAKTHSGQISLFEQTFGPAPTLSRLLDLRARADYALEDFAEPVERLEATLAEAQAFLTHCRRIVSEATARDADEPDPPPDV